MKYPRLLIVIFVSLLAGWSAQAEPEATQEIADRFEVMVVRSPQAGAAFDRVIEWYSTQGGGLELLQKRWSDAAAADAATRRQYLILQGLLAERLRTPDKARELYRLALAEQGDPAQAARLLAALETTEGNFPAAAEAYNKALASETIAAVDRMELMRSLALLYQRSFEDQKALEVWRDAMAKFPDDPYVLDEAGEAFLAAGDYDSARKTFTRLSEISARDPFRKIAASLRLARTDELEGKTEAAVHTYELALEETSSGSWINREVRSRIEELFRRKDDLPGLLAYYEKRAMAAPQDYESLAAQADVLDELGRNADAIDRIRAATKLAPDNLDLRLPLIRRLSQASRTEEAITEAAELAKPADATPESLVLMGNLYWSRFETAKNEKDRDLALAAWQRIAPATVDDVARVAQLAEILASHGQTDAAVVQWQRIIALSPDAVDARQRIAEVDKKRGDKAAAMAVLQALVEGDRSTPENYLALSRIQARLEWPEDARATSKKAIELFPTNYELLSLAWSQAIDAEDADAVEQIFPKLWENAPNEFFAEDLMKKYVSFLESAKKDKDLAKSLAEKTPSPLEAQLLFRLAIAQQDQSLAGKAVAALKLQPNALRAARAAAEYAQAFGTPDEQIAALQAVAVADPRMAGDSLRSVARIQAESGQVDEALKTISQLIERTPADATLYTYYADIASRDGKYDLAVARLREAMRYVENATSLRLQLAGFLQSQGRSDEGSKVLQEAFEKEENEGRRMEIFRRQIEGAMMTGKIDELIASLRERQAKEQGGARYGAYLAEIYILQNDFLAAREELARSLGRNPDNAASISRLIDLADRGGDQAEALRLARRLAELEPSRENRAALLARLFTSGELEDGKQEFARLRPEILKDPSGWNAALVAMRKAGLDAESDAVVEALAADSSSGIIALSEVARLRLMQRNYPAAEKVLWQVLESQNFSADIEAVISAPAPAMPAYMGYSARLASVQSISQIHNSVTNSLAQLFQPNSRGYSSRSFGYPFFGGAAQASNITPDQRASAEAFFTLAQLAAARGQTEEFTRRVLDLFDRVGLSRKAQFSLLATIGNKEAIEKLLIQQAADPSADPQLDKLFVTYVPTPSPASTKALEAIQARADSADPDFAFERKLAKFYTEVYPQFSGKIDPKTQASLQERIRELVADPAFEKNISATSQVANIAANVGLFDIAFDLLDKLQKSTANTGIPYAYSAIPSVTANIILQAIAADDPRAQERFEKSLSDGSSKKISGGRYGMRGFYGASVNMLAQQNGDLVIGDSEFPVYRLQLMNITGLPSEKADKLKQWFASRASSTDLDLYTVGAFYSDWFGGKREDAVKRLEAIYQKNPTPRAAALLLEVYERIDQPAKALALIDTAALQETETPLVRKVRKIRLLRSAGKLEESKALAEEIVRGRIPADLRDILFQEMTTLGIAPTKMLALSNSRQSRSSRSREQQIREQVSKLVSASRTDEAESIALQILQRPLPQVDDYQELSLRQSMVNSLQSMKRIDDLQVDLRQRLEKSPGDSDLAIRLFEASDGDEKTGAAETMVSVITAHPEGTARLGYALQLLQRGGDRRRMATQLITALIRTNPGYLAASGFPINEIMNRSNDPESSVLLAEAIAELSDDDYNLLFVPARLSRYMSEVPLIQQLAESAAQGGKQDAAIKLLMRGRDQASAQLEIGLPLLMRLAELQFARGDKIAAADTMKLLVQPARSPVGFMMGRSTLNNALVNIMANSGRGSQDADPINRLAKLADQTGTLDFILESMSKEPGGSMGMTPALVMRTYLQRPEAIKEWRRLAQSDNPLQGFMGLPMLGLIIDLLAEQKDSATLIPALVSRVSEQQMASGGDANLYYLAKALPTLAKYRDNAIIKKHVSLVLNKTMSDPNMSRYLANTESYGSCIDALLDAGFSADARRLFDFTATARSTNNYGNKSALQRIEARLNAAEGRSTGVLVICAASVVGPERMAVYWNTSLAMNEDADDDGREARPVWESSLDSLPEQSRPMEIEIFAGPNPAALQKLATVNKPKSSGSIEVKPPSSYGLLQARWKQADGSPRSGPLTVFVAGENLIERDGVPEGAPPDSGYKTGLPGPVGKTSAVSFQRASPQPEVFLPLVSAKLGDSPAIFIFSGWVKGSSQYGNIPTIQVRSVRDDGKSSDDNLYMGRAVEGQWTQVSRLWTVKTRIAGARSFDEKTASVDLSLLLRGGSRYGMQMMSVEGQWAGLRFVRIQPPETKEGAPALMEKARQAARKTGSAPADPSVAADFYLQAFQLDPSSVLNQGNSLFETFQKAGRLADLYTQLAAPALYLPNPLIDNQATFRNESLLALLVREAVRPDAPKSAAAWLASLKGAPLRETMRFLIEAGSLREQATRDPSSVSAKDILATFGFKTDAVNAERVRNIWNWSNASNSTLALLDLVDQRKLNSEMISQLKAMRPPVPAVASQHMLLCWLQAPLDPSAAIESWNQVMALRQTGQSSVNFDSDAINAFFARLSTYHPSPGDLITATRAWFLAQGNNEEYVQRQLVEMLYTASKADSPHKNDYATRWADAEIAAMQLPNYNSPRERIRELARRLMDAADWDRLDTLLAAAAKKRELNSEPFKREFDQIRDLAALARGRYDNAWPVAWARPGTNSRNVSIHWQWNIRDFVADEGKFDAAVSVPEKPLVPAISGQSSVEVLFGETPSAMKTIGKVDGDKSTGSLDVELSSANGFFRVVALVGDRRVPGPIVPFVSGRRLFPAEGSDLMEMLKNGEKPFAPDQVVFDGVAPDGSPAIRMGISTSVRPLGYTGPEFSIKPAKFYVARLWMCRVGTGAASAAAQYHAVEGVPRGNLNMIITDRQEATGQWVLFTRAIPSFPQHTFWIPYTKVDTMVPVLWEISPGTKIAGFEVLEIDDWKYGEWLGDIAMLREQAGDKPDAATIQKALDLAAVEPLTALDYHGEWLAQQAVLNGQGARLIELARSAFSAEPNPLFARPKLYRVFNALTKLADTPEAPNELRLAAIQLAIENSDRARVVQRFGFQRRLLAITPGPETLAAVRKEIMDRLSDPKKGRDLLQAAFSTRSYVDDRPGNEFLDLMAAMRDPEMIQFAMKQLNGEPGRGIDAYERPFAGMALEACLNPPDASWKDRIDKAFVATKGNYPADDVMSWPSLLGELLAIQNKSPDVLMHLRRGSLERVKAFTNNSSTEKLEAIRAACYLIESASAAGDEAASRDTAAYLIQSLQRDPKLTLSDNSLRLLLRTATLLADDGDISSVDQIVKACEKDIRRTARMTDAYARFLKTSPVASPSPSAPE